MATKRFTRPPPKLRTKTGCSTCRTRRKKCDEVRPICSACHRLNIQCVYREASSSSEESRDSSEPTTTAVVSRRGSGSGSDSDSVIEVLRPSPFTSSVWCGPYGLRTKRDFDILRYTTETYMNVLVYPEADVEFRKPYSIFAASSENAFVMHAALAPAALHASAAGLIPREDAMIYTQSALQGLRKVTRDLADTQLERNSFLAGSLFMGIFEDFYPSETSSSLTFYRAIGKVLEESMADVPRFQLSKMSIFERTLLDSVLYHLATRLVMAEDIEPTVAAFPTGAIAKYIEAWDSESEVDAARAPIRPVIGDIPPALFLIIYQITWLSRQLPLEEYHQDLALQCLADLDRLQAAKPKLSHEVVPPFIKLSNCQIAAKLYALALRIFIWKVIDPEHISNASPRIESLLATGLDLLKRYDGELPFGQFICWPILVLGCAACPVTSAEFVQGGNAGSGQAVRAHTRQLIKKLLQQIWNVAYSGHVTRCELALVKIWQLPGVLVRSDSRYYNANSGKEILYDGLLALISKGGPGTGLHLVS
ncbi:hypothetical protein LTR84_007696 [Exophiala bonariae]|uniref:Zn(2)-C6 fungal-type domain-containing protein n=1 Tax=Exophiala bonariae TaxID=1690606 RepID=A0AAV9NNH0_9EURO|nr:hypothetical protein LTR84_007696 [Exophiala bonariae]